jgi:hypothetical protein
MHLRSFARWTLLVALGACAIALPGCAADDVSASPVDDSAEVDELNTASLRASTAMKGSLVEGSAITLHYDRSDAKYPRAVPYLAVEILSTPTHTASNGGLHVLNGETIGAQRIAVQGTFPGTPRALVVDEAFRVLARGSGTEQADGTQLIDFGAPRQTATSGKRFLLIRDGLWTRPMDFQVRIGQ